MIYSFDIFDTCLVRKCGHPENMLDVLSWRVFSAPIDEMSRREFVCARKQAENDLYSDPFANIYDIYSHLNYTHLGLQSKEELANQEIMCERMLLTPVLEMQTLINKLRNEGHQIAFISDMYLPFGFLKELLSQYDLLKEDDNLFVSCQVGKRKSDGTLFQYLHHEYGWKYSDWHHYGDNITSDYHIPRKLGINAHKINHSYAPYESQWVRTDYSENRTKSIIAGICRAIRLGDTQNTHTNFVLDIVAPLYASFVWRIMEDAANNGIRKLFFCARDAYLIYLVALKYHQFFPSIEIKYLYISQQSLYKGNEKCRLRYFDQIGLASKIDKVAIVDIRSSGHTLSSINQEVQAQGCLPVRGYFFEIYCNKGDMTYRSNNYYAAINTGYHSLYSATQKLSNCWHMYEMFFSIHDSERTIDYTIGNGVCVPVFDVKNQSEKESRADSIISNRSYWKNVHETLVLRFVDYILELGLVKDADEMFTTVAIPTLCQFTMYPNKKYLCALEDFYVYSKIRDCYVPYARRENLYQMIRYKFRSCAWRRGMLFASLPDKIIRVLMLFKEIENV